MSKKVLRLLSILFLSSILVLSCSNADKTGSGDNNIGNGGSSTGGSGSGTGDGGTGTGDGGTGDGGTTTQGIEKYAGTWTATFNENTSYDVVIGNDGTVTIKDGTNNPKQATDITENGNTYNMNVQHSKDVVANVTIIFDNGNSGTIDDESFGKGTITKK